MMHPVDLIYHSFSSILSHALGVEHEFNGRCSCCNRESGEFGNRAFTSKNGYGEVVTHCASCQSFFVTDIGLMGVERLAHGIPIGQKFGMLSGCGGLIEVETRRVWFFVPPGVMVKLPEPFLKRITTLELKEHEQLPWICRQSLSYPLLYVRNFGRKTQALVRGLRYSRSSSLLIPCDDTNTDSASVAANAIDLTAFGGLWTVYQSVSTSARTVLHKAIRQLANGTLTPIGVQAIWAKQPELLPFVRLLPADPHQRLAMLANLKRML